MKKRLFAMLLALALVLTYMPAFALAADEAEGQREVPAAEMAEVTETQEDAVTEEPEAETSADAAQPTPDEQFSPVPVRGGVAGEYDDEEESEWDLTNFRFYTDHEYTGYIDTAVLSELIGYDGEHIELDFRRTDDYSDVITLSYYYNEDSEDYELDENDEELWEEIDAPWAIGYGDIGWEFYGGYESFDYGDNDIYLTLNIYEDVVVESDNTITVLGIDKPARVVSMTFTQDPDSEPMQAYVGVKDPNTLRIWPQTGDLLEVEYDDDTYEVFTFDDEEWDFLNEDGYSIEEVLQTDDGWWLEFRDDRTAYRTGDNPLSLCIYDMRSYYACDSEDLAEFLIAADVDVEGIPSDVRSITLTKRNVIELQQEIGCEEYLYYDAFAQGDVLTVTYTNGTKGVYTYYDFGDYGEFIDKHGSNSEDKWDYADTPDVYDDQETEPWTEGYYSFSINYHGKTYKVTDKVHVTQVECVHDLYFCDENPAIPRCVDGGDHGVREHYICEKCGKSFADEEGTIELDEEDLMIPIPDHDWELTEIIKATTAANGSKVYTCSYCDSEKKVAIPKFTVAKTTIRNTVANSAKKTNDVIWDKVSGATSYELSWRAKGASKWAAKNVGNTVRGVTTGLTIGGLYEIRVRPYRAATTTTAAAYGPYSASVYRYFHTTGKIRLASNSKGSFTMSWAKNSAATGYQILYTVNKNGSGAANNIVTVGASTTSVTRKTIKLNGKNQALKSGTTYYVQVRELKKVGNITYVGNISCPVAVKVK